MWTCTPKKKRVNVRRKQESSQTATEPELELLLLLFLDTSSSGAHCHCKRGGRTSASTSTVACWTCWYLFTPIRNSRLTVSSSSLPARLKKNHASGSQEDPTRRDGETGRSGPRRRHLYIGRNHDVRLSTLR